MRSIRPLPSGKWLTGCATEAQQSKLAHLDKLPGRTPIGARIPRPMGGDELKLVKQDLEAGGHRVARVVRLNSRKQEPSLAVKISLEATELPTEVWLGATPFTVQAFAAPVSDPWAIQAAVSIETDLLLQVRERFALTRTVRRAGLLLREL